MCHSLSVNVVNAFKFGAGVNFPSPPLPHLPTSLIFVFCCMTDRLTDQASCLLYAL